jgi:hypothetical protein
VPVVVFGPNTGDDENTLQAAYLSSFAPGANFNGASDLPLNTGNFNIVIDVDVSSIPSGATINAAALRWVSQYGGDPGLTLTLNPIQRNVVMGEVSWNEYASGSSWAAGGGSGTGDIGSAVYSEPYSSSGTGLRSFSSAGLASHVEDVVAVDGRVLLLARFTAGSGGEVVVGVGGSDGSRPSFEVDYSVSGGSTAAADPVSADGSATTGAAGSSTAAASGTGEGAATVSATASAIVAVNPVPVEGLASTSAQARAFAAADALSADGLASVSGAASAFAASDAVPAGGVATVSATSGEPASEADAAPAQGQAVVSALASSIAAANAIAAAGLAVVSGRGADAADPDELYPCRGITQSWPLAGQTQTWPLAGVGRG